MAATLELQNRTKCGRGSPSSPDELEKVLNCSLSPSLLRPWSLGQGMFGTVWNCKIFYPHSCVLIYIILSFTTSIWSRSIYKVVDLELYCEPKKWENREKIGEQERAYHIIRTCCITLIKLCYFPLNKNSMYESSEKQRNLKKLEAIANMDPDRFPMNLVQF